MVLYIVPTTRGDLAAACSSTGSRAGAFLAECGAVVSTLSSTNARPRAVGPGKRYLAKLEHVIARLNAARVAGRRRLIRARTPTRQARAAKALGRVYGRAARSLGVGSRTRAENHLNAGVVYGMESIQDAYLRLTVAARRVKSRSYESAQAAVRRRERVLGRRLQRVKAIAAEASSGYPSKP